jgi:TolB protein
MTRPLLLILAAGSALATGAVLVGQSPAESPPAQPAPAVQQPDAIELTISGEAGAPPRFAVPDFIALSPDAETAGVAGILGQVLWDDLEFEREFYLIPRDTYATIPRAPSIEQVPFDAWRELGADGVVIGSVRRVEAGLIVQVRLFDLKSQRSVFAKEYSGAAANPRLFAHTIADEIHQQQRGLQGIARSKLTYSSDRDGERMAGPTANRNIKEIYISDYDGSNQRRVTVNRALNIFPVWSADGRSIAYTSYRRNNSPDIYISNIYQGTLEVPLEGTGQNWLAAWSPDGSRLAFTSNRDGNPELYVVNRDGTALRRVTNHPAVDTTPTWSPAGNEVAFTSDRTGSPQIYVVSANGGNPRRITTGESYADRATWAPAPYNEIAYAARTGPGYDIVVYDLASGSRRQLTFGEGTNESPVFARNGRHIAFTSTRRGLSHVFLIGRDGRGLRQVTTAGNNFTPNWSR